MRAAPASVGAAPLSSLASEFLRASHGGRSRAPARVAQAARMQMAWKRMGRGTKYHSARWNSFFPRAPHVRLRGLRQSAAEHKWPAPRSAQVARSELGPSGLLRNNYLRKASHDLPVGRRTSDWANWVRRVGRRSSGGGQPGERSAPSGAPGVATDRPLASANWSMTLRGDCLALAADCQLQTPHRPPGKVEAGEFSPRCYCTRRAAN